MVTMTHNVEVAFARLATMAISPFPFHRKSDRSISRWKPRRREKSRSNAVEGSKDGASSTLEIT